MPTLRILGFLLLILTLWTLPVQAQSWSGIIDRSRAIDWNQAGVPGGIPTNRPNCTTAACLALATGGVGAVTTATINAAIAANPGTVINIRAGTFTISGGISLGTNNVTLRGAGPDQTKLVMTGTTSCLGYSANICLGTAGGTLGLGSSGAWSTNWTGPYTQGTTVLNVASTANIVAGRIVVLDQLDDTADTGGIMQIWTSGFCQDCFTPDGRHLGTEGSRYRPQQQIVKVVSVDSVANQITITPGVYMPNWRSGQSPQVWGWGTTDASTVFGVGLEDMTIDTFSSQGQIGNLQFSNSYGCWIKNVRSLMAGRGHFQAVQAAHFEVRDSYFYGSTAHQADAYGINITYADDFLIINSIMHNSVAGYLGKSVGSVLAYNYTFDNEFGGSCAAGGGYTGGCTWVGIWNTHYAGGGMTLAEGNQTPGYIADNSAGNSPLGTMFRNHFNGWDDCHLTTCHDTTAKLNFRQAIKLKSWARAYNVVGNVLGTSGVAMTYQASTEAPNAGIYILGSSSTNSDALVASSLLRWGNYDTTNAATRWVSAEIPTTGITYINGNAVPATQTLPASFFLSGQPSFWVTPYGTPAWPPIGPDVTGGNVSGVAGHVYDIPAKRCFNNLTNDPAYSSSNPPVKLFNANACYGNTTSGADTVAPAAPKNLTVQ